MGNVVAIGACIGLFVVAMIRLLGQTTSFSICGIAQVVERVLTARRPRARYPAGADAHVMIAMKAILPTRVGDAVAAGVGGVR